MMLDNELHHNHNNDNNSHHMNTHQRSGLANLLPHLCSTMPVTPKEGIIVQVKYVGACYPEGPIWRHQTKCNVYGEEIAGVVHDIGAKLQSHDLSIGQRVVIIPNKDLTSSRVEEFIAVDDTSLVLRVPDEVPLDVAAMLPGGALRAYAAFSAALPHVENLERVKPFVNILVVGGGSLGLWAVRLSHVLMSRFCRSRLFVADNSVDKLLTALDHGPYDIIHWNEEDHEQYIVERTLDACRGGVDVIIDFVSSTRTIHRSLKVLNKDGIVFVGGWSCPLDQVTISPNALAAKQQSIVGIPQGTASQLRDIVSLVAGGKLRPPSHTVFPIDSERRICNELFQGRLTGRAVFMVGGGERPLKDGKRT